MSTPRFWTVVPAAGVGRRFGGEMPKQYRALAGRPLLAHTLERLGAHRAIAGMVVAVADGDRRFDELELSFAPRPGRCPGGAERCHSVLNGVASLAAGGARDDDWVLVHDAVRPCLPAADLDRLIEEGARHPVGALLAVPVRDTLKRADDNRDVERTVAREGLWHAHTPQMFRLGTLHAAIERSLAQGAAPTDEARAMELAGHRPHLVEGSPWNLKVTTAEDLALAERILAAQSEGG